MKPFRHESEFFTKFPEEFSGLLHSSDDITHSNSGPSHHIHTNVKCQNGGRKFFFLKNYWKETVNGTKEVEAWSERSRKPSRFKI